MKILLGISTHNRADILPKAIESALAQSWPDKEIAVFDDASTDATPALRERFPHVRWERSETPRGYVFARNKMMRETDADLYASLDDDSWFLRNDELSLAVRVFQKHPEAAAVAYDILSPERPNPVERGPMERSHLFIGCGHVVQLDAARQAGFYAAFPGAYGVEEKDLCLRLMDAGREIYRLPGVHVWHDKTAIARDLAAQHRSGVANDLAFLARRCPMPLLMAALPRGILAHLRFAWRRRSEGFLGPCLKGLGLFAQTLPATLRTREAVRSATFREFIRRSRSGPLPGPPLPNDDPPREEESHALPSTL
jgi:glycosyltransferase involved in cell wall biosynthesis